MKRAEVRCGHGSKQHSSAFLFNLSLSLPNFDCIRATVAKTAATTALTAALVMPLPSYSVAKLPEPNPHFDTEHALADEVWRVIDSYYLDPSFHNTDWDAERAKLVTSKLPDRTTTYKTLRKSIAKLGDRYTRILKPSQMAALRKFDVSGVGLLLTTDASGELIVATDPAEGTPAAETGVRRGDVVLSVNGRDVAGVGAFEVAEWMQGPEGSVMRIRFRDCGETSMVRHFTSDQNAVTRVAVVDREDGRLGYIRLKEFSASGRSEVTEALDQLSREGAEWVVLDLRGNGGGVFEGALEIAGLFEGEGHTVARVKGRSTKSLPELYKSRIVSGEPTSMNLGILLDHQSASSSEVLAGALQDECRAALIGERTYGKGVIQGVFGLSDGGGVVVTVAEYRTPLGNKIDGVGLSPDLPLSYKGVDGILKALGIERTDETSVTVSRDQIQDVLRSCKEREGRDKV